MSKERARAREERERLAAAAAAKRDVERARAARRTARRAALVRPVRALVPAGPRVSGELAERRRRQVGGTLAILGAINVLTWVFFPQWQARAFVLAVSLLAAPVLHTMLFRKST